ncbi:MAG: hypothetical protein GTO45_37445 [Candidatus Aminicenantes bacterium]|nr:hypothetical protein [Candidatus Aminicenantes bacterium]NIM84351.1 hypothetical protein [Candidatus Aminicenantes bacterium]NIN23837.1 hypothetical protein [Candidatus Aminicenantes bacterium]NIN47553.1 hypothetical protein [Candidatus Aminicenantes bacterium]NIN90473.1 hypothetical protein [Candidatus Aminicenantes bacterium]
MKRRLIKYGILVFVLIMLYFGYLLYQGSPVKGEFTEKDLAPASLEPDNGFYIFLAFLEPPEVDIYSPEVIAGYRETFNSPGAQNPREQIRNAIKRGEDAFKKIEKYDKLLKQFWKLYNPLKHPLQKKDPLAYFLSVKEDVEKIKEGCSFLLKRYQTLMDAKKVEDFSHPGIYFSTYEHTKIIIQVHRLFHVVNIIDAAEGKWESAVGNILKEISFYHRFLKTARGERGYGNYYFAWVVLWKTYELLPRLLNHKSCPGNVYARTLAGLQAIPNRTFTHRNAVISTYIANVTILNQQESWKIYIPRNRIKQYYLNAYRRLLELGDQPPYQRRETVKNTIRQMMGNKKIPFDIFDDWGPLKMMERIIRLPYQIRALNDLICICAELYLKYDPGLRLEKNLEKLDTYKAIDPFSGTPYRCNPEKRVFYSIGPNRSDDGGMPFDPYKPSSFDDIVIPIILPEKDK